MTESPPIPPAASDLTAVGSSVRDEPSVPAQATGGGDGSPPGGDGIDVGRIARAGALNLVGAAISVAATVGLTVFVTRSFTTQVAGAYFTLTSLFLILAAAGRLGADTGVVYMLAGHRARGEAGRLRSAIRVAYAPTTAASLLLLVIVWFAAPGIARWLFASEYATSPNAVVWAIRVFALCLPGAVVGLIAQAAARGLGNTRPYVIFERVARPGLQLLGAVIVVVLAGATAWVGLAASYSVPYILAAALMIPWLIALRRRTERRDGAEPSPAVRADWTTFWKFSGPRAITGMLSIALQRLDLIIVAALRGASDAALYAAATRFLVVGQTASNALSMAVQHRFSALLSVGRRDDANRLYQMTTTWLILMVWPFYLTWAVLAHALMKVFGAGYSSGSTIGVVLALAMLVATACGMVSMVLEMAGNTGVTLAQTSAALAADVGLDLLLIPHLGPLGAAIGWAAAILLNNLVPLWTLHRRYRLFPIARGGAIAMIAATVCFAGTQLVSRMVFGDTALVMVATFVVGTGAYAVVVWRARHVLELAGLRALTRRGRRGGNHRQPEGEGVTAHA